VIEELMKLDIELLAEMKLNLFILGPDDNLREETFRLLVTLKENLSREQRSKLLIEIVRTRQMNYDTEAISLTLSNYMRRSSV
jgi:hypothetical protein